MTMARPLGLRGLLEAKQVSQATQKTTGASSGSASAFASINIANGETKVSGEASASGGGSGSSESTTVTSGYVTLDDNSYLVNSAAGKGIAQGGTAATDSKVAGSSSSTPDGPVGGSMHQVIAKGSTTGSAGKNIVLGTGTDPNI